jgi:GH24 family phage-related lysozyme (muramidase)
VTLDPGFDLCCQTLDKVRGLFGSFLDPTEIRATGKALELRGRKAKDHLGRSRTLAGIRVSRARALRILPHVAVKYWTQIARRFPDVGLEETPGSVQTVMLSLAYNRGSRNQGLNVLKQLIQRKDWLAVASTVGDMQQNHELQGIRTRRRMEADLIRQELIIA